MPYCRARGFRRCVALVLAVVSVPPALASETFQIGIREDGLYRVTYESLVQAGLTSPVSAESLRLMVSDTEVPVWVQGGEDGTFGPGDSIEFLGRHRPGANSYYNQESHWHVYQLKTNSSDVGVLRLQELAGSDYNKSKAEPRVFERLEQDRLRVRFKPKVTRDESPDLWYWLRLSTLDSKPARVKVPPLQGQAGLPTTVRLAFRGWSTPRLGPGTADHRVEVWLDGEMVGSGEWDGQSAYTVSLNLPADKAVSGGAFELRVPSRVDDEGNPIVDVSLLDWVEVEQPFSGAPSSAVTHLISKDSGTAVFRVEKPGEYVLIGEQGSRHRVQLEAGTPVPVALGAGETFVSAVSQLATPEWVRADDPSALKKTSLQADYLMISHASLLDHVMPLADFHRSRGLNVEVIDVQNVYDEFGDGMVSSAAIRDFIGFAYSSWRAPAPRFVLLVGDASWDVSNETPDFRLYADWTFQQRERKRFIHNASSPYPEQRFRNLIPAWTVTTYEGLAASDNGYVTVEGNDIAPDLAIGRLPVVEPEEVQAIVSKTIGYAESSEVGPWRRNVLWITNEERALQRASEYLSGKFVGQGLAATKIYPTSTEQDNEQHQQVLSDGLDSGQLIVHFLGHGGRYIWRTGPPDIQKNHDLFTLDHLDALQPSRRLPLVLSMTCYSAPFDHPTADSIGEKFLRLPDRGAVAVFAASWRNRPTRRFSEKLLAELTQPGVTIGEAIAQAKSASRNRVMVETYNLLGDPAVVLAYPAKQLALSVDANRVVTARIDDMSPQDVIGGQAIIDWLDTEKNVVATRQLDISGQPFTFALDEDTRKAAASARIYFWNSETRIDAMGHIDFSEASGSLETSSW